MKGVMRTLSLIASMMMPEFMRGTKVDSKTGKEVRIKPRYVAGDKFYNYLSFKRVNGKWRVKK